MCLLAGAIASNSAPSAAATQKSKEVVVTERLTVRVGADDVPKATVTSVVDAPRTANLPEAGVLSTASPTGAAYHGAVASAVGGWWLHDSPFSLAVPLNEVPSPRPQLDAERAVTTVEGFDWIRGFEDDRPLGDWLVDARGDSMTFVLAFDATVVERAGSPTPPLVLRVVVDLDGPTREAVSSAPQSEHAGAPTTWEFHLRPLNGPTSGADQEWRDEHRNAMSEFWITVRPGGTAAWFMRTNEGAWWWLVQPLSNVLAWLAGLLALLLVSRHSGPRPPHPVINRRLTAALLAAGVSIVAVAAFEQYRSMLFVDFPPWGEWALMVEVALPLAVATTLAVPPDQFASRFQQQSWSLSVWLTSPGCPATIRWPTQT